MERDDRIIDAVTMASLLRPDLMTGDAINALAGGHGMLNVVAFCTANVIAEKIQKGRSLKLQALNQIEIEMDEVVEAGVKAAMENGADPSNAALITALLCYLAGSNVRAGVPSGNRKLGAMARMKAGVQRGGVLALPTPKSNNRVSGFPAVMKIYDAMLEGKLTQVDGADLPAGVGGGPLCGHSAMGEDYIFPELAENAASIGASAMMKAYRGAGMKPNPLISAVFGAAAALEIVHPDAVMPERYGPSFQVYSQTVAGIGAVKATGLPETLHFRVTGEEFNTAQLIGDLGIILKDGGTPTVVGMLAFYELLACFAEGPKIGTGSSGGPRTAPIGHVAADASLALRTISLTGSVEKAAEIIAKNKKGFVDPEFACIEANTVARKVEELKSGDVSQAVLLATNGVTRMAIEKRSRKTIEEMGKGKSLTDVIMSLEEERLRKLEQNASAMMSENLAKKIEIKVNKFTGGARRAGKAGKLFYVLDPDIDVSITIDGEKIVLENFAHEVIPKAVLNKDKKLLDIMPILSLPIGELMVSGHTLIDLVVPVATAAVLGKGSPEELGKEGAKRGSLATGGLPGGAKRATEVARLAMQYYKLGSEQYQ